MASHDTSDYLLFTTYKKYNKFRNPTHPVLVQMNLLRSHGESSAADFSIHTTYLAISSVKTSKSYTKVVTNYRSAQLLLINERVNEYLLSTC